MAKISRRPLPGLLAAGMLLASSMVAGPSARANIVVGSLNQSATALSLSGSFPFFDIDFDSRFVLPPMSITSTAFTPGGSTSVVSQVVSSYSGPLSLGLAGQTPAFNLNMASTITGLGVSLFQMQFTLTTPQTFSFSTVNGTLTGPGSTSIAPGSGLLAVGPYTLRLSGAGTLNLAIAAVASAVPEAGASAMLALGTTLVGLAFGVRRLRAQ
ncbi:MAG TPA: hypothetical protein VEQ85_00585 [Lacipirellulaceae bacterium]|nr:hypothetical protein [Lacipirellulaceae bacterium]